MGKDRVRDVSRLCVKPEKRNLFSFCRVLFLFGLLTWLFLMDPYPQLGTLPRDTSPRILSRLYRRGVSEKNSPLPSDKTIDQTLSLTPKKKKLEGTKNPTPSPPPLLTDKSWFPGLTSHPHGERETKSKNWKRRKQKIFKYCQPRGGWGSLG